MSSKSKLDYLNAEEAGDRTGESNPKKFKNTNDKRGPEDRPTKKFIRREENDNDDDDSDVDDDEELKISREDIDFSLPKPGPHAKSSEWRKWKQMQRAIRQIREEKRILKREKLEKQKKEQQELQAEQPTPSGRSFTLSIAIPGSIFGKVQSKELKTYVAGQIARAAVLFCVDEIIVYNDYSIESAVQTENTQQLIKILEYLECPQYLRKSLFPPHKHLEYVGLLNPLEAMHHFKIDDDWKYREGVVTDIPSKDGHGSYVDIGLYNKIQVDKKLQAGIRVTVKRIDLPNSNKLRGVVVSPETPRIDDGIYWGYQVRNASSFRKVIYETSFKEAYDLKIAIPNTNKMSFHHLKGKLAKAKHILVVFGGKDGIEAALEADEKLRASKIEQVFNFNCEQGKVKSQASLFGSRTIRLEEALLISLSLLRPHILSAFDQNAESAETGSNDENNEEDESDDDAEQEATDDDEEEPAVNKNGAESDDDDDEEEEEGSQDDED